MAQDAKVGALFGELAEIMARLRGPNGCPWDREQTPDSLRKYTLEETYEVLEAIERRDAKNLAEELGDLLLQVLFYAQIASESDDFSLVDVLDGLRGKLIRRHPHVFGEQAAAAAGNQVVQLAQIPEQGGIPSVLANWKAIKTMEKAMEKGAQPPSAGGYLSRVARGQTALSEAAQIGSAAAQAGFDWPDARALLEKVREEAAEVEAELVASQPAAPSAERLAEETGDLLFTAANLARHLQVDAEIALRDANQKFRRRFEAMERESERLLEELTPAELEQAWLAAKAAEARPSTADGGA